MLPMAYLFGSQQDMAYQILLGKGEAVISDPLADIDLGWFSIPRLTQLSAPGSPNPPGTFSMLSCTTSYQSFFEPYHLDLVFLEEGSHSVFQLEAIKGRCIYQAL